MFIYIVFIFFIFLFVVYYFSVYIGWSIGVGDIICFSENIVIMMGIGMYFGLIVGVVVLVVFIYELVKVFDVMLIYM